MSWPAVSQSIRLVAGHRSSLPYGVAGIVSGCPVFCQLRHASKKKNLDQIRKQQRQQQLQKSLEASKPTLESVVAEFGEGKVKSWEKWKYKGLIAPEDKLEKRKKRKDWLSFEKKGLILPKHGEMGKSMLFRKGPSQEERDEEELRKKLAMVEHIEDPEVRKFALEDIEDRERRLATLDPHGFLEKLEQLAALGQPDVPAKDGIRVLVIHPRVKYTLQRLRGSGEQRRNIAEWDLQEAVSLVDGMGTHYAAGRYIISQSRTSSKSFFTDQGLEEIQAIMEIDCFEEVMVNHVQLSARQRAFLESLWECRVYDRFNTVLHIFKNFASTPAAKLQIRLAELENEQRLMKQTEDKNKLHHSELTPGYYSNSDGDHDLRSQKRKDHMDNMIKQVNKKLDRSKVHREIARESRRRKEVPLVALVGYTNAGKTSLVKALCGSNVEGESRVFATLDSTVHRLRLPSGLEVVVSDTIGFISELPPTLMATFESTLADSLEADVVLHIRDATHPNTEGQRVNVMRTLLDIGFSDDRVEDMVEVNNKIDLAGDLSEWQQSLLPGQFTHDLPEVKSSVEVSAKTGQGMEELKKIIEEKMLESSKRHCLQLTIPSTGKELSWLHKNAGVSSTVCSDDGSELIVDVVLTSAKLGKFSAEFPHIKVDQDLLPVMEDCGVSTRFS
ncbi:putative GTP-binding protein 6 [Sycon ciliatum]|uniref:putative GTP-binding protein 6 n=1 Tax=Sycon ciliatum TaxID=27933 RepID=UPI0020AB1D7D|eukprot:scpid48397/ scgid0836/ Putative GTP-binding protein 6; Pseudoautosomal GTP-binding protein-like